MSAPSGAGKDSIRDLLIAWKLPFHFAVTATTREKRADEIEGVDYHFLTDEEFRRLESEGGLLEKADVYGQRKGVPRVEVLEPLQAGRDVFARVDIQGADTLKRLIPHALMIFIAPPSLEETVRRLDARDTESGEDLQRRIDAARSEMEAAARFDYVVVNETGKLEEAARRVVEIIAAEKGKRAEEAKRSRV
jgi:guanylate kinase